MLSVTGTASAHPMPNTLIDVSADSQGTRLLIAVPLPELRLALPAHFPESADRMDEQTRQALTACFNEHFAILSTDGARRAHVVESLRVIESIDPDVGRYRELTLQVWVPASASFDPRSFTLRYDAVMHQVPNHLAIVRVSRGSQHSATTR